MNKPILIQTRGLEKKYKTPERIIQVLSGVDLDIEQGERVAIVGTSGAGKTTLMHLLGGLDHPSGGEVLFEGQNIYSLRGNALDTFRNKAIGFVFQFHQLLPEFSALENVMMPILISGRKHADAAERASNVLAEVGLTDRLKHKPGALSGGEQQRVAIARALVLEPKLLLADEPTGNLDSRTSDEIMALLNQIHAKRGLTMIIVTHNQALAKSLDRVLQIEDGCLVGDILN